MRSRFTALALFGLLVMLVAACGEAQGTIVPTPVPTEEASVAATATPVEEPTPTTAVADTPVAEAPTLPVVEPAEPTATATTESPQADEGKPSLIFFTAPG